MSKKVAYQGVVGSFSSMAARALYGSDLIPLQKTRFRDIFEDVAQGRADVGVVPIENALAGSVHENYDLLQEYNCFIIDEFYCPVHMHLLGLGTKEQLHQVLSHPKALEQCSRYLESNPHLQALVFSDTAGAAQHVAQSKDTTLGAIASEEAAATYGLNILEARIQNHQVNATRFVAIGRSPLEADSPTRGSIVVRLPHQPGSLYRLLGEIATLGVNLTKIESRPIAGKPFEYAFHIDVETAPNSTTKLGSALEKIQACVSEYRLLGCYHKRPFSY